MGTGVDDFDVYDQCGAKAGARGSGSGAVSGVVACGAGDEQCIAEDCVYASGDRGTDAGAD